MANVVIGNDGTLANYPQGGGHWSLFLQYLLGLRALGHDAMLLEVAWVNQTGTRPETQIVDGFFRRLAAHNLAEAGCLLVFDDSVNHAELDLEHARVYGCSPDEVRARAAGADVLWNFAGALRGHLLSLFPHRVFLDVDPGVLQLSALQWDFGLQDHHAFLTVGLNVGNSSCEVPLLDRRWNTFPPFVHLPMWVSAADPGHDAAFTSVTHWNWDTNDFGGRTLSTAKRDSYLVHSDLPHRTGARFQLATSGTGGADGACMKAGGWELVDAWQVAESPQAYQDYIARSRGEICCPKPIFSALRTGWVSDRSVCYLASGRPVLMEDTGLAEHLPTTSGLVTFVGVEEARDATLAVVNDYARHCVDARRLAEEVFSAAEVLPRMLGASA